MRIARSSKIKSRIASPAVTLKARHQQGDVVTIYQDPITCRKVEGNAQLCLCLDADPEIERWLVKFHGDIDKVQRFILPKGVCPLVSSSPES